MSFLTRILLAWLIPGLCATVLAQDQTPVWQGTIGRAAVVVELDPAAKTPEGRYFYRRHLRDIRLGGTSSATGLDLRESAPGEEPGAHWALEPAHDAAWSGEWRGTDGSRLPIRLTRVESATGTDPAQAVPGSLYESLRSQGLRLEPGAEQTVGGYRLQWFREPRTGVALFQVLAGYPEAQRLRVNRRLRERHWQEINAAIGCIGESGGDYDSTTTLHRIDATVISFSLFASYYCGGAHPDFGDQPLNLDPRTGRELALEDVLWLGKGAPPAGTGPAQAASFEYRDETLGPWLARTMARLHPDEVHSGEDEDDCDYSDAEVWAYVSWSVRDDGLLLGPSFPRAARDCEYPEWALLPWSEVERHRGRVRVGPGASGTPAPAPR